MHEGNQLELLAEVDYPGGWVVLHQLLQGNEISADQHEDAFQKLPTVSNWLRQCNLLLKQIF